MVHYAPAMQPLGPLPPFLLGSDLEQVRLCCDFLWQVFYFFALK